MIYHLLQNPSKLQILTNEIRSSFKTEEEIKGPAINNLKYLNAVINESMRLNHPAPETTRRITNPGGNTICGDHIPGDVCAPSQEPNSCCLLTSVDRFESASTDMQQDTTHQHGKTSSPSFLSAGSEIRSTKAITLVLSTRLP